MPCAFLIGEIYNNNFYCQYTGYHPDYTRFSVGSLLTARVFEELAAAGVQRVDLGEGGQEHNRRIGCQMVKEGTVHVYSPTLRGVWLSLFFGTTQIVRTGGRRVRSTFRLNGLGRVWRQYLLSRRKFPSSVFLRTQRTKIDLNGGRNHVRHCCIYLERPYREISGKHRPVLGSGVSSEQSSAPRSLGICIRGFLSNVSAATSPVAGFSPEVLRRQLGASTHICPKARIWAPWNLVCSDKVAIADEAIVYNPARIELGSHAIVSQQAYLCSATHDYEDPGFPLVAFPISVGPYAWVCARATVQPGVSVGEGAVLALGSVATHDLEPWTVYGGVPARKIKVRRKVPLGKEEAIRE